MSLDALLEEFEELEDWEEQCDFLIDLGFELPVFPDQLKLEQNIVPGCQSHVWLVAEPVEQNGVEVIAIQGDSDAIIVKGLIAVLLAAFDRRTARQILDTDIIGVFNRMGLNRHLSPTRRNGLHGMVKRIRNVAAQHIA